MADIWLILLLINCLLILFKLFEIKESKISFSIWTKLLSLNLLFGVLFMFYKFDIISDLKEFTKIYNFLSLLIPFYITYAIFMFRYEIKDTRFRWFNGIYLRSVNANRLERIVFHKDKKNRIGKIVFISKDSQKTLRNDMNVDSLVKHFAQLHGITLM